MQRIGELYAIEAAMRYATVDARHKYRQREAMPRLQAMHDWLINQRLKIADGSGLARAIDYSLKRCRHWSATLTQGICPSTITSAKTTSEPPRVSWRLPYLREWSHHEQINQVFP